MGSSISLHPSWWWRFLRRQPATPQSFPIEHRHLEGYSLPPFFSTFPAERNRRAWTSGCLWIAGTSRGAGPEKAVSWCGVLGDTTRFDPIIDLTIWF